MPEPEMPEPTNWQMVAVRGENILVMNPRVSMTKPEALMHAAWLVVLADGDDDFAKYLDAVKGT